MNASDTGAYATIAYRKTGGLVELKVQNAAVKNITIPNGLTTLISSGIPAVSTPFYAVLAAGNGASILLDVRGTSLSIWNPGSAITTNVLVGHTMYIASS